MCKLNEVKAYESHLFNCKLRLLEGSPSLQICNIKRSAYERSFVKKNTTRGHVISILMSNFKRKTSEKFEVTLFRVNIEFVSEIKI